MSAAKIRKTRLPVITGVTVVWMEPSVLAVVALTIPVHRARCRGFFTGTVPAAIQRMVKTILFPMLTVVAPAPACVVPAVVTKVLNRSIVIHKAMILTGVPDTFVPSCATALILGPAEEI